MIRTSIFNRTPILTKDKLPKNGAIGYIYLTINKVNHKKYVGKHCILQSQKDYNYIGSGILLQKFIDKYGKSQFDNWILDWAYSFEELNVLETQWISDFNAVNSVYFYNIKEGGEGFTSQDVTILWELGCYKDISGDNNPSKQPEVRNKLSQSTSNYHTQHPEEQSERMKKAWKNNRDKFKQTQVGINSPFWNRGKPVICVETQMIFPNANRAADWILNTTSYHSPNGGGKIRKCCNREKGFNTAFGYHWEYYIQ